MLWLLLLLQIVPLVLIVAGASGILDPVGTLVIQSIPLPAPGERSGFLINTVRFVTVYWFLACLCIGPLGSLAAVAYVAFDRALTKAERLTWALGLRYPVSLRGSGRLAQALGCTIDELDHC
jgi:hypothetical protein